MPQINEVIIHNTDGATATAFGTEAVLAENRWRTDGIIERGTPTIHTALNIESSALIRSKNCFVCNEEIKHSPSDEEHRIIVLCDKCRQTILYMRNNFNFQTTRQ